MGYISIFLGLAVVVALMIRRWSPLMVGIVAATVVILMNGLPFGETMTGTYFDGFCTMFKSLFPPIFSGSLLAQIYNRSGLSTPSAMPSPMLCLRTALPLRASMFPAFWLWQSRPVFWPSAV